MAVNFSLVEYPEFIRRRRCGDRQSSTTDPSDQHWEVEDLVSLLSTSAVKTPARISTPLQRRAANS